MIVLKLSNPRVPELPALFVRSVSDLSDIEATIGNFLCVPGDEQYLLPGIHLTVEAVEMSEEDFAALPSWEDA